MASCDGPRARSKSCLLTCSFFSSYNFVIYSKQVQNQYIVVMDSNQEYTIVKIITIYIELT